MSGLTVEMFLAWHAPAQLTDPDVEPDEPSVELWEQVLELIRLAFEEGVVPQDFCHSILVLIPKSVPGEYCGIALLEIINKLVLLIIN